MVAATLPVAVYATGLDEARSGPFRAHAAADGRYALIECKLGSREINEGAAHLLQLKSLIQEYNADEKQVPLREPDLLIVVTGDSMAYTRPDGVKVIPLACLKD